MSSGSVSLYLYLSLTGRTMTNVFTDPVPCKVILCGAPIVYVEGPAEVVATDNLGNNYTHNPQCSSCSKDALYGILEVLGIDALDNVDLSTVVISDDIVWVNAPFGDPHEQLELNRIEKTVHLKRYQRYFSSQNQVALATYHSIDGTPTGQVERVYATDSADIDARYGVLFDGGFAFCVLDTPAGRRITRYFQTSYLQAITGVDEFNNTF
jgi:hypothetical protein